MLTRLTLVAMFLSAAICLAGCGGDVKPNPTEPGYQGYQGPQGGTLPGGSILGDSALVFALTARAAARSGSTPISGAAPSTR